MSVLLTVLDDGTVIESVLERDQAVGEPRHRYLARRGHEIVAEFEDMPAVNAFILEHTFA